MERAWRSIGTAMIFRIRLESVAGVGVTRKGRFLGAGERLYKGAWVCVTASVFCFLSRVLGLFSREFTYSSRIKMSHQQPHHHDRHSKEGMEAVEVERLGTNDKGNGLHPIDSVDMDEDARTLLKRTT